MSLFSRISTLHNTQMVQLTLPVQPAATMDLDTSLAIQKQLTERNFGSQVHMDLVEPATILEVCISSVTNPSLVPEPCQNILVTVMLEVIVAYARLVHVCVPVH